MTETPTVTQAIPFTEPLTVPLSEEGIRESYRRHAALAQYHRWFLLYENDAVPVENSLDILAPDVTIASGLGEASGHDAYRERVAALPAAWDNAHHIRDVRLDYSADDTTRLVADVTYQNHGMLEDGGVREAELTYTAALAPDGYLPKFTSISITQNSEDTADAFEPAYAENRLRATVHAWLAFIEHPDRTSAPYELILADDFVLNFSSGVIDDREKLQAWLAGPASSVQATAHRIENFTHAETAPGRYDVGMEFDWQGLAPDGTELIARTRHSWKLEDDPADRFARITQVDVEILTPFQPRN